MDTRVAKLEAEVADLQERVRHMKLIPKSDALDKPTHHIDALLTMAIGFALGLLFCSIASRFLR